MAVFRLEGRNDCIRAFDVAPGAMFVVDAIGGE
jgi:hypothetical protein